MKKQTKADFDLSQKTIRLFVTLCCLLPLSAPAVTLEEELKILLETHPQLSSQQQKIAASEDNLRASQAAYLPSINLTGSAGKEHVDPAEKGDSTHLDKKTASINIEQNLFSGYADDAQTNIANLDLAVQTVSYEQVKQNLMLSAIEAYLGVIRQHKLLEIAKQNERNIEQLLALEEERYKHGASLVDDILQAKTRLQNARERRSFYQNNLDSAVSRYVGIFEHAPDIDGLQDIHTPEHVMPMALSDALVSAGNHNPDLESFELEIKKARQQIRVEKSAYAPSIDLVGSTNWQEDAGGVEGTRKDNSVMLEFTWNLYDGLKTTSKVSAAGNQLAALNDDYVDLLRKIEESVRLYWDNFQNGRQRLSYLKDAVTVAADLYENRQQLRAAGQNTAQNVLDARSEYFDAQTSKISADYDTKISAFRLLRSCGTLNPDAVSSLKNITQNRQEHRPHIDPASTTEKSPPIADNTAEQPTEHYVLQLMAMRNRKSLENFLDANHIQKEATIYTMEYQGNELYLLTYGNYKDKDSARQALASLPDTIKKAKPWIRKLSEIQMIAIESTEGIKQDHIEHASVESEPSANNASHRADNILAQPAESFVLQLMAARNRKALEDFMTDNHIQDEAAIYTVEYLGNDLHVLIYGNYEDKDSAIRAVSSLPDNIKQLRPWAKKLSTVKNEIKNGTIVP